MAAKKIPTGYITVAEAATKFGLSQQRIRKLLLDGTITGVLIGPAKRGIWFLSSASMAGYVAQAHPPGPKPGTPRAPRKQK